MTRVHSVRPGERSCQQPTVRLNRMSLLYNLIFTIKLVITPFFAYLAEPYPWAIPPHIDPAWNATSLAEFSTATAAFLRSIYNNRTLSPSTVCYRDDQTNSNVIRMVRTLPPSEVDCIRHLVRMPGAGLYGIGMQRLACDFLAETAAGRDRLAPYHCEHMHIMGLPMGDACLWFEATSNANDYMVHHAILVWENQAVSWGKLLFRCLLTTYILRMLWRRYYRHYAVLLSNLRMVGMAVDSSFCAFEIVVGDPTYLVISNPFVSIVMMVDIWLGVAYLAIATVRASQYKDGWIFLLACMYIARYVWAAYLVMWILSRIAKRRGWEASFSPVDPALLGVLAAFYGGPMLLLVGNTVLMRPFNAMCDLGAPANRKGYHIEAVPGCVVMSFIMALVPVIASTFYGLCRRSRAVFTTLRPAEVGLLSAHHFCPRRYNDFKCRFLLAMAMRRVPRQVLLEGGALYSLIENRPSYRRLPLFSHRGSDCVVIAYLADKTVARQMRLSLLACLDLGQTTVCVEATSTSRPYCKLSTTKCPVCPASNASTDLVRLHKGANDCQWVIFPNE